MGLFNNKENEKMLTTASKYDFKVVVWEDVGYSVREIKTITASRFLDEDKTPFIYNEEEGFLELYPQDMQDNVKLNEKEINDKINKLENKIKEIKNKKIEDYSEEEPNINDLEWDLRILLAKKRGLEFSQSASYVCFNREGEVTFNFLRKGNRFYPFKWDTDTNHIYTPPEPVVKKAGILLRNKETKYSTKKLIETSTLILLIFVIIGTLGNIYLGGWLWKKYDESNLADLKLSQIEAQKQCTDSILNQVKVLNNMINITNDKINNEIKPNIQGIMPS